MKSNRRKSYSLKSPRLTEENRQQWEKFAATVQAERFTIVAGPPNVIPGTQVIEYRAQR